MVIKADSPAGFAEQYIVESIWNGGFPAGSLLPAERELSEMIGVTRTTLREVLQRLARDGWLKIKHGKPTQVNDFWKASNLNVLSTLVKLEKIDLSSLLKQVISARNQVSLAYWLAAIKLAPEAVKKSLHPIKSLSDEASAFSEFESELERELVNLSENKVFLLLQNGFNNVYQQISSCLLASAKGRAKSKAFHLEILACLDDMELNQLNDIIEKYNQDQQLLLDEMKTEVYKAIQD